MTPSISQSLCITRSSHNWTLVYQTSQTVLYIYLIVLYSWIMKEVISRPVFCYSLLKEYLFFVAEKVYIAFKSPYRTNIFLKWYLLLVYLWIYLFYIFIGSCLLHLIIFTILLSSLITSHIIAYICCWFSKYLKMQCFPIFRPDWK